LWTPWPIRRFAGDQVNQVKKSAQGNSRAGKGRGAFKRQVEKRWPIVKAADVEAE
jgi:hypothetical protein